MATALHLRANYRDDPAGDIVYLLAFDESLLRAAEAEGRLRVYKPPPADASDAGEPAEQPS